MTSELGIDNLQTQLNLDIDLKRFRYAHSEIDVLQDLKLNIHPGTVTVISGGSGSGKSTLGANLAGILPRTGLDRLEGALSVSGKRIEFSENETPRIDPSGWAQHIAFLPQDANDYLSGIRETVAEEMAFALENRGVPRRDMLARVRAVADLLDINHLLAQEASKLSGGQARIVALGALIVDDPQVLVLDEPLAGLDENAKKLVLSAVQTLKSLGKSVVVLTRNDTYGADLVDKVLRLEGGELSPFGRESLPPNQNLSPVNTLPQVTDGKCSRVLLDLAGATLGYGTSVTPTVSGFNLKIHAGECVALVGPNGVGKTTVLKAAAGLIKPKAGTVRQRARVGLLLQNPNDQLFERTVFKEVSYGLRPGAKSRRRVLEILHRLSLQSKTSMHPYELSMSERKFIALASVLVHEPEILLLDEPTEGLDEKGMNLLRDVLEEYRSKGRGVLITSHDDSFVAQSADRKVQLKAVEYSR